MAQAKARTVKQKAGLKPCPYTDGAVSETAVTRVIRMVAPYCPVDGTPEIRTRDGKYVPNPNYTGETNCQQAYKINNQGRWDVEKCVSLGHDPYHTKFRRPILEEILDDEGYVMETKVRYKTEKILNIVQISDSMRQTSGREVELAKARGHKFLEEFGMASPCEFRNCTRPQQVQTKYGRYCSERHARLVAADKKRIALPVTTDPYIREETKDEREALLENISIYG